MAEIASLLSLGIALIAASIAFGQWYTARSKLVLDLFNQRMDVYSGVRKVMGRVMQHGTADIEDIANFSDPQDRARFLAGDDVNRYFQELRETLARLGYGHDILQMQRGDAEYQKALASCPEIV